MGIRPWLDKWEIRAGDSLVQRLLDEGLAHADAVILVTSEHSFTKRWVREELDHATVQRITRGTRLIPVRLDDVEMPAPLVILRWIDAERSEAGVQRTAQEIADTIHGYNARPAVGPPPKFASLAAQIPGLTPADAFVLQEIIREAMSLEHLIILNWHNIQSRTESSGLTTEALMESVHALAEGDYVDVRLRGSHVQDLKLTRHGYAVGIEAVVADVHQAHQRIIAILVNTPPSGPQIIHDLADRANTEVLIVDQLLRDLEDRSLVSVTRGMGGASRLHEVSPTLRRLLD